MSFPTTLRSLATRRAVVPVAHTRSMYSAFGPAPRRIQPASNAEISLDSPARLHVVANGPSANFYGVPLGAFHVSAPYHEPTMAAAEVKKTPTTKQIQ